MRTATTPDQHREAPLPIARDIQNVVSDAQELLKTVQTEGESRLGDVKAKVQQQLDSAQADARPAPDHRAGRREGRGRHHRCVRARNPWRAVGISAALGALIGFLAARR